jgi:pimeloyl-ACP methyl ester carboxylesterase
MDGARLYYEVRGCGPLLLMIPGANGSADAFNAVADCLARHLTVVTYDRRGFSRNGRRFTPPRRAPCNAVSSIIS